MIVYLILEAELEQSPYRYHFFCEKITAIDHPECLKRMRKRCDGIQNIDYLPGNFLDLKIDNVFKKNISYSVLHCLRDDDEVLKFIRKAISL